MFDFLQLGLIVHLLTPGCISLLDPQHQCSIGFLHTRYLLPNVVKFKPATPLVQLGDCGEDFVDPLLTRMTRSQLALQRLNQLSVHSGQSDEFGLHFIGS